VLHSLSAVSKTEKRSPFLLLAYHQIPSTSIITSLLSNLLKLPSAACHPRIRAQKKTTESRGASIDLTVHLCIQRRMQRVSNLAKRDPKPDISTAPHVGEKEEKKLARTAHSAYRIERKKGQVRETSTATPAAKAAAALAAKQLLRETSFVRRLVICSSQGLSTDPLSNVRNDFRRLQGR